MNNTNDDWEVEDLDEEDVPEDFEDWYEEPAPMKTGAAILTFLCLLVLAAVICGFLWNFTHKDRREAGNTEALEESLDSHTVPESVEEPAGENAQESSEESVGESAQESSEESVEESAPESMEEPVEEPVEENIQESVEEPVEESVQASENSAQSDSANRVTTKDGRVIVFTDCDDMISPKIYVNLRLEPSTSEGNATVHCRLEYEEKVHRTGISEDSGWSRVEKDGVVCYVVTSYMYVVEE